MNPNWAAENLQTIRTLMERSAVYRRAMAPVMMLTGVVGLVAGVGGWFASCDSPRRFILFWFGVAAAALVGSFVVIRRQALRDHEPFWSLPTRRIAQAMLPCLYIGLFPGLIMAVLEGDGDIAGGITWLLVPIWMALYGAALHSAGFFMRRGIRLLGCVFIFAGTVLLLGFLLMGHPQEFRFVHVTMGIAFGGLHLAYGTYLQFTEKNVS